MSHELVKIQPPVTDGESTSPCISNIERKYISSTASYQLVHNAS